MKEQEENQGQSVSVGTASAKAQGQKPVGHIDGGQRKVGLDWGNQGDRVKEGK